MRYSRVLSLRLSPEDLSDLVAVGARVPDGMKRATLAREAMRLGLRALRRDGLSALERLAWVAHRPDGPAHLLRPGTDGAGAAFSLCGGDAGPRDAFRPAPDRERCTDCEKLHEASR